MKSHKPRLPAKAMFRIRMFQISGLSLITLGVLNMVFLKSIGMMTDAVLLFCGGCQLHLSFWIWKYHRHRTVKARALG